MHSTKSEDFLSTVRTTAARPGQVVDVVVLTSDTSLLEALRSSAGSEHALWEAPSADAAVDYLVGGRCDVLIADLASLHGDVAALLERLQAQFPELIFMAIGRREDEGTVASLLSTGRVYRFLHKPISPGRAFQFLNAATRRHNEQRDGEPIALQTVRTIARKPYLGKVAAASAGVIAAVIAFVLWQSRDQGLPATLQATHVGDAPVEDTIKSKLGSAQIAFLSGRLLDPRGDNALEYYKAVLAMQPGNAEAKTGVQKVIDTLEQRVVKALEERNAARVVTAWTALQRAAPNHPQLDTLRAQLLALSRTKPGQNVADNARSPTATVSNVSSAAPRNSATAPGSSNSAPVPNSAENASSRDAAGNALVAREVAERELADAIARELAEQEAASNAAAPGAPTTAEQLAQSPNLPSSSQAEQTSQNPALAEPAVLAGPALAEQLASVASFRERGALISPAGSNAFESVMTLRTSYPDAEEVRSEQQRLAFVLLDRARTALAGKNVDEAATLIEHADKLIPGMQAVRTLQEQLSAAQAERDFNKNIAQAGTLKRVKEVPPVYPRDAQRAGTEGWVQVEFTISPDGSTRDLQVRNSEPAQVFDKAALDSVSKWRFEPVRKNGTPVAQRAVLQVRFVLN